MKLPQLTRLFATAIVVLMVILVLIHKNKKVATQSTRDPSLNDGSQSEEKYNIDDTIVTDRATDLSTTRNNETINNNLVPFDEDKIFELTFDRGPKSWNNLNYYKIESNEAFRNTLKEFTLRHSAVELSYVQKDEIVNSLYQLCLALNIGSFDAVKKFRIPTKYHIKKDATDFHIFRLVNRFGVDKTALPEDPNKIWELYWKKTNESKSPYTNLWQAIAKPEVWIHKIRRKPSRLMDEQALKGRASFCPRKSVEFDYGPKEVLQKHGSLVLADYEIIVDHITGLQYPIIIRSFWDDTQNKWVPIDLVVEYTRGGRKRDPDF
jgi:hypothetical protein